MACHGGGPRRAPCEFFTPSLRITHPWTRASAPGASTAVVCMKFDEVSRDDRLTGVATPVAAGAEMHGGQGGRKVDFRIAKGRASALGETGVVLRLVGLHFPLQVGREYPLTLTFEQGGVVNATLSVDYASFA